MESAEKQLLLFPETISPHSMTSFMPENGKREHRVLNLLAKPFVSLTAIQQCRHLYQTLDANQGPREFFESILIALDIQFSVNETEKAAIPKKGPLVIVANHPFGALEGIMLTALLLSIRPDIKVMANFILDRIPQMRELLLSVDPNPSEKSMHTNIGPMRKAIQWVQQGGALLVFPSGTVSHLSLSRREISDPAWNTGSGKIIHKAQAPVLPIFIDGANGTLFQLLGLIHPALRTALLPRELVNKRNRKITIKIGKLIPYPHLRAICAEDRLMGYLRWRTYLLSHAGKRRAAPPHTNPAQASHRNRPVAGPMDPVVLLAEINTLPVRQQLITSGPFTVWQASFEQIPRLMIEISRLREQSFRLAGEGSGNAIDMDAFDSHYLHIFIWNNQTREVVGAYRLGRTDIILDRYGKSGLYTATLFHSHTAFYEKIGPALELGRSFVRPEYQKSYSPLLLLWKGIGHFIARNPKYRMLFGPVSISRDYSDFSRQLITTTLLWHHHAGDIAAMVRPKSPPALKPVRVKGCQADDMESFCRDIHEVNAVISDIEIDNKGIPILLKHYLNLGGQILAFNVDKQFNHALDGLIIVDLFKNDQKTLARYMGKDGAAMFFNFNHYLAGTTHRTHTNANAA
ncbi:MAG: GNAT family N-acyltransferase [Desulfobacterales bacterium]|jgi:putative hemolysin|nr:GNAT family N-acyltransferase [Desulfobacterales bacterium]